MTSEAGRREPRSRLLPPNLLVEFLAFRQDNPSSIVQCVTKARENERTIRDYMSREMWENINSFYFIVNCFQPDEEMAAWPHRFCHAIRFGSHRLHGVTDETQRCVSGDLVPQTAASLQFATCTRAMRGRGFPWT